MKKKWVSLHIQVTSKCCRFSNKPTAESSMVIKNIACVRKQPNPKHQLSKNVDFLK